MLRYSTLALIQATTIAVVCCLPMALNKQVGFVGTAFLTPIGIAWLIALQIGKHGELFEVQLIDEADTTIEIRAAGGRQQQWFTLVRLVASGFLLAIAVGIPAFGYAEGGPGPPGWRIVVALFAVSGLLLFGYSVRQRLLLRERHLVTEYRFLGCPFWSRCWRIRPGDAFLVEVVASGALMDAAPPEFRYAHTLLIRRGHRRRRLVRGMYASEHDVPDLARTAERLAELAGVPFEGYRVRS